MNWPYPLLLAGAILAEVVGVVFLLATVYFSGSYIVDAGNPLRRELLTGFSMALSYAAGALALSSVLTLGIRRELPRLWFRLLCWPGIIIGALFVILTFTPFTFT